MDDSTIIIRNRFYSVETVDSDTKVVRIELNKLAKLSGGLVLIGAVFGFLIGLLF